MCIQKVKIIRCSCHSVTSCTWTCLSNDLSLQFLYTNKKRRVYHSSTRIRLTAGINVAPQLTCSLTPIPSDLVKSALMKLLLVLFSGIKLLTQELSKLCPHLKVKRKDYDRWLISIMIFLQTYPPSKFQKNRRNTKTSMTSPQRIPVYSLPFKECIYVHQFFAVHMNLCNWLGFHSSDCIF